MLRPLDLLAAGIVSILDLSILAHSALDRAVMASDGHLPRHEVI
jgi:hypothetical protein